MLSAAIMTILEYADIPIFEELYNRTRNKAYAEALDMLGDASLAEDCVSEAFLSVAKNLSTVSGLTQKQQLRYVMICVRNAASDMLKKKKSAPCTELIDEELPLPTEGSEYSLVEWKECLRRLGQTDMDILYLRYILGLDYRQISSMLGISEGAARTRLYTAKAHLRELFGKEEP